MHENSGYHFANLQDTCCRDIETLERKLNQEAGREIVLLAFEKER